MSTPDAPLVQVAGPAFTSEAVLILTTVGGFLAAVFGQDWGMRAHAQDIASAAAVLAPVVLALVRALKHRGAQQANAAVAVAQIQQAPPTLPVSSPADAAPAPVAPPVPSVSDL